MAIFSGYSSMASDGIAPYIEDGETLREYTIGNTKSTQMIGIISGPILGPILGPLAEIIASRENKDFIIALTDKRLILAEIASWKIVGGVKDIGKVQEISLSQVLGLKYENGISAGTLIVYLADASLEFKFEKRPWYPRAQNMARLLPISKDQQPVLLNTDKKSPILATTLSFFLFGGAGQIYLGQWKKGLVLIITSLLLDLFFVGILITIIGISDAYGTAQKINSGDSVGEWKFNINWLVAGVITPIYIVFYFIAFWLILSLMGAVTVVI